MTTIQYIQQYLYMCVCIAMSLQRLAIKRKLVADLATYIHTSH